jgi:hypothetical protein
MKQLWIFLALCAAAILLVLLLLWSPKYAGGTIAIGLYVYAFWLIAGLIKDIYFDR